MSLETSVTAGAAADAASSGGAAPAPNPFAAAAAEASASLSKMTNAAAAFAMAAVTGQKQQQQQARSADLEAQQHGERASQTSEAEVAAANIQAALRGRQERRRLSVQRETDQATLRQQVIDGCVSLDDAAVERVQGMLDWALSAAPALAISVRAQRQTLRKRAEAASGMKGKQLLAGSAVAIKTRPNDLARRAHAWVERQITAGFLSGRGALAARQLLLAIRQVKDVHEIELPSPSKRSNMRRRTLQQPAQEAGVAASAARRGNAAAQFLRSELENAAGKMVRNVFGAAAANSAGLKPAGSRTLLPAETLMLCRKLLDALLDVGMLHETNEWLQEQLAWRGPRAATAPAAATATAAATGAAGPRPLRTASQAAPRVRD